jgi:hypothetical protein
MSLKATGAGASQEPTLHCPNCNHEIKLTESLAAPLLEETRQRFNEQLAAKDAEVARRTEALRKEQDAVAKAREQIEDQVGQRLTAERSQLVATEAKKAREAVAGHLQAKEAEAAELRKNLEANNAKLAEAHWLMKSAKWILRLKSVSRPRLTTSAPKPSRNRMKPRA